MSEVPAARSTAEVQVCPACGAVRGRGDRECANCGSELSLLVELESLAQSLHDEALGLAKDPDSRDEALRRLHAALALDPRRADTLVVLGKLLAQSRDYVAAIRVWEEATKACAEGSATHEKAVRGIAKATQLMCEQRDAENSRRRRGRVLIGVAAIAVFAVGATGAMLASRWPVPNRSDPVRAAFLVLTRHPALATSKVQVSNSDGAISVEGEAPSRIHVDLMAALAARECRGLRVDLSRVRIRPTEDATRVQRALDELPKLLRMEGVADDLKTVRVKVEALDGGRLRMRGDRLSAQAFGAVSEIVRSLAPGLAVDFTDIRMGDGYGVYTVSSRDDPRMCDSVIAAHFCGSARRWADIQRFNSDHVAELSDPFALRQGTRIKVPWSLLKPEFRGRAALLWRSARSSR